MGMTKHIKMLGKMNDGGSVEVLTNGHQTNGQSVESTGESQIVHIKLSDEELKEQAMESRNVEIALDALRRDGVVVIDNAVPTEVLDFYNETMVKEAQNYVKTIKKDEDFNFGGATGNFQLSPPLNPDFTRPEVMRNPFVLAVVKALLGPQPVLRFWSSNAAMGPSTKSQPVHTDANHKHLNIPFGLIANINCVSTSAENGATELWPGTHLQTSDAQDPADPDSFQIEESYREKQRAVRPPLQPSLTKGSVILRDILMWHTGKPNKTPNPRIMLSLFYSAAWYRSHLRITLPKDCKTITDSWTDMQVACDWRDGPVDHLTPEICHSDTDFSENRNPDLKVFFGSSFGAT